MYVLDEIFNNEGNKDLLFLGAKEPKERGVKGMIHAIEDGCDKLYNYFKIIIHIERMEPYVTPEKNGL